jgi:O-antigen ligase
VPGPTDPPQPILGLSTDPPNVAPGVLDLYRAIAATSSDLARRWRLGTVSGLGLTALYFLLRMAGGDETQMLAWLAGTLVLCLASPGTGLMVLAAIGPFNEAIDLSRDVGSKTAIAAAIVLAIGARWALLPSARARASAPVVLALALLLTTGLGLIRTELRWGLSFAALAAGTWLQGVATMLLVFVATVWIARHDDRRPLIAALVATTIAGIISLADFSMDAALRDGPLYWAVVGEFNAGRLTGVIRSPTSTAALVMLPVSVYLAAVVLAPRWRLRVIAAALAAPLLAAAYLTYNRAVFIVLYALAVVIGWRIGRRLGIALLVAGIVAGAALVPWYLSMRGQALGGGSQLEPGQVLIASDQQRLGAWAAAGRMFLDEPLFGQGYRAYRQLSVQYGDPILNAPHNEWLRLFAEHGIFVGLLGLAFLLATAVRLARAPGWLGAGLFGAFLSVCIAASFNNVFLFNQVTIPAMVMAGTGVAISRRTVLPGPEGA